MKIPLTIKVHPVVREFYVSTTGSDTIDLAGNDNMAFRIKTILQLTPKNYKYVPFKSPETITLLLPNFRIGDKRVNQFFRNHLDDRRQYFVSKELYSNFKSKFHNYVLAYMRGGGKQQKLAIEDFCDIYNLSLSSINFDMLKKSWDRSEEKKILKSSCLTVP